MDEEESRAGNHPVEALSEVRSHTPGLTDARRSRASPSRFTSPTLKFYITTPDLAPQSFYDQHLATTTMSPDLPVIRLYHLGRAISQLPRGVDDLKAERRRKRNERRRSARLAKSKTQATDESESGTDESEDERESEQMVAMERYRWDRSAVSHAFASCPSDRSAEADVAFSTTGIHH